MTEFNELEGCLEFGNLGESVITILNGVAKA